MIDLGELEGILNIIWGGGRSVLELQM
jgi:hypothetical protein